jgi:hypothetical protein
MSTKIVPSWIARTHMQRDIYDEVALKVGVNYSSYTSRNAFLDAAIAAGCCPSDARKEINRRWAAHEVVLAQKAAGHEVSAKMVATPSSEARSFLEKLSEGDREQLLKYASSTDGPVSLELFCKKYLADKASAEAAQAAGAAWAMADEMHKKYTAAQEKLRAEKVALEELRLEWIRRTENAAGLQEVADSMNKVE